MRAILPLSHRRSPEGGPWVVDTRSLKPGSRAADPTLVSQPPPDVRGAALRARFARLDLAGEACNQEFDLRARACPRCGWPAGAGRGRQPASCRRAARPALGDVAVAVLARRRPLLRRRSGHRRDPDRHLARDPSGSAVLIGPAIGLLLWLGVALYGAIESGRLVSESSSTAELQRLLRVLARHEVRAGRGPPARADEDAARAIWVSIGMIWHVFLQVGLLVDHEQDPACP